MAESTGNPGYVAIDIWETECLIHRVPRKLRKVNESAYTPQLVSIGPFHHGNNGDLREMESLKEKYYDDFRKRSEKIKKSDLEKAINECYEKLPNCYEGIFIKVENDRKEFEQMILRDACFIIELFLRNAEDEQEGGKRDCILRTPWLRKAIKLDLILLENQLPFFVLRKIFKVVKPYLPPVKIPKPKFDCSCNTTTSDHPVISCGFDCRTTSFTCCQVKKCSQKEDELTQKPVEEEYNDPRVDPLLKLTRFFFEEHFLTESGRRVKFDDIKEMKHFTDLLRIFWLPRENIKKLQPGGNITERKYLYSATKLDKAGVTFKPSRKGTSLTDAKISRTHFLKFVPGINCMLLKLPELKLENDTECLLRNVMALEQCLYPEEDYVCGYVALMDQLINTREDVEFLVDKKILTNLLGSNKEAAKLINSLCNQIPRDKSCYAPLYNELNKFYENRWNVTRATFKKVYFKDLWTGSSTVVGIFVLLFTVSATLKNVYFRHL
ncbi:hypothetical protein TorRG33x02_255790 [Trema orientale]|uniref:Uncharacterized protein n=1 Tax=Trema orientale TaxID=63057 RepID=A0A2P5DC79_TREOI|nr:hypothetical protein TorRG33x02_255790 [Trema orientale]